MTQSLIARIEVGGGDRISPRKLETVAQALGARVYIRLEWNGEALDRLLDQRHAGIVELVVRQLRAWGWEVAVEATFAIRGERGSIDVLAWHAPTRTLLVVEVKSVVPDMQATLSAFDRKVRLAPEIASRFGWRPVAVARLLVVGESRTARRRVSAHQAVFDAGYPDRNVDVRRFLQSPSSARPLRGLWFLSPSHGVGNRHRVRRPPSAG